MRDLLRKRVSGEEWVLTEFVFEHTVGHQSCQDLFPMSDKFIAKGLDWKEDKASRIKRHLVSKGILIEVLQFEDDPATGRRRYNPSLLGLDQDRMAALFAEWQSSDQTDPPPNGKNTPRGINPPRGISGPPNGKNPPTLEGKIQTNIKRNNREKTKIDMKNDVTGEKEKMRERIEEELAQLELEEKMLDITRRLSAETGWEFDVDHRVDPAGWQSVLHHLASQGVKDAEEGAFFIARRASELTSKPEGLTNPIGFLIDRMLRDDEFLKEWLDIEAG